MMSKPLSQQRGMSLFGWVFTMVFVAYCAVVLLQVFPTVVEYVAVRKAVQQAAKSPTITEAHESFEKSAAINGIQSIKSTDLEITALSDRLVVRFAYEREFHLGGPVYLTLKYTGRSK